MNQSAPSNPVCACGALRKATRLVTQMYDEALKPSGLLITQFGILMPIKKYQPVTITQLANWVVMDRTTLTRNLKILEKQGLVSIEPGQDQRTRIIRITHKAENMLNTAIPLWEAAQKQFIKTVGEHKWTELKTGLTHIINRIHQGDK